MREYTDLLQEIIAQGTRGDSKPWSAGESDRAYVLFGAHLRFDLACGFPHSAHHGVQFGAVATAVAQGLAVGEPGSVFGPRRNGGGLPLAGFWHTLAVGGKLNGHLVFPWTDALYELPFWIAAGALLLHVQAADPGLPVGHLLVTLSGVYVKTSSAQVARAWAVREVPRLPTLQLRPLRKSCQFADDDAGLFYAPETPTPGPRENFIPPADG